MSAHPRPRIPSYRLHKQSGQAVVTQPARQGGRRAILAAADRVLGTGAGAAG